MTTPIPHARRAARLLAGCLLGWLALTATGCGPGAGDVSGMVSAKGVPLVFGTVTVVGGDGIPRQGMIRPDGSYSVIGVPSGPAKIGVVSPDLRTKPGGGTDIPPDDDPERYQLDNAGLDANIDWKKWRPIPMEYANPIASGLTVTVGSGVTKHDIELK